MRLGAALTHAGLWSVLMAAPAWSREAASSAVCQAAATRPAIAAAKAATVQNPADLQASFRLADAWSDAGCFGDALQVLQTAAKDHPGNDELVTRLRVARSLIGEEHYFDDLARVEAGARLRRAAFRCTNLADQEACREAQGQKKDEDAAPRQKASEPAVPAADAGPRMVSVREPKAVLTPRTARAAHARLSAARFSNEAPATRTH